MWAWKNKRLILNLISPGDGLSDITVLLVGGTYCFWDGSHWRRRKTSCPLCNLNTLWNILMMLGRNLNQDEMTCCIQDWQHWLSYFWSYHPLFYLKKILCPLCNSNALWNSSLVLGRNVEQAQMTCHVQEWQLCLSYFWRYLPLLYLTVIIHWFHLGIFTIAHFLMHSISFELYMLGFWNFIYGFLMKK